MSDSHPIGAVSRAYGVYRQEEDRCCRALIVLDGGGRVFWSHTYPFNLDPGIDGVFTALEMMQARERDQ